MTRRLAWFGQSSYAESPTTEALDVVGVPYLRIGSRLFDIRSGIEATLNKRTMITGDYTYQWLGFDQQTVPSIFLLGGDSHGASGSIRYGMARHLSLLGTYNLQLASVIGGGRFGIHNSMAGVEFEPSPNFRIFGTAGLSRLSNTDLAAPRIGPAFRFGVSRALGTGALDGSYSRSFVPSFGFAGTFQNEELIGRILAPLARRLYTRGSVSWRRNEPLVIGALRLKSTFIDGGLGYEATQWMRVEGFYEGLRQEIDRPGGHLVRNRIGVQIVTGKPMRIR
jgi:hypothetical protein